MTHLRRSNLRQSNKTVAIAGDWGVFYYKVFLLAAATLAAIAAIVVGSWDFGAIMGVGFSY